ncbi:MAG TPA: low molecular weight protein-tyrosine-phosphatase [Chitinophagales bacterium]|nr:low molecular weight phosphotyrosine protein phosphatase [Chitinophagales bacterium]HMW95045.1 low molecular weight protein-tyrosine-phosphatase [Chitinophagales bacterium]
MKILMVCLGNICRSPLAEGILKDKCKKKGLNWEIDSAGTGRWHVGSQPDKRSIEVAKNHGIDITDQSARSVNSNDYSYYDIIYAMDTMNLRDLKAWAVDANEEGKIRLILNEIDNFPTESVPDPYFNDNGFEAVFNMLDKACDAIIKKYG